ncbi:hypothetical protein CBM2623_A10113 [Cupriavidus taiwanensis]|nr:hypothetical protein CBM2623_A10113 [Cupriavidus taiwanensis]
MEAQSNAFLGAGDRDLRLTGQVDFARPTGLHQSLGDRRADAGSGTFCRNYCASRDCILDILL